MKTKVDPEEINLASLAQKYSDENKARALFESWRWPAGPVCPHCQFNEVYKLTAKKTSKKSVSAHQIHRMIGVTYKTAWFLCHRIRYAMGTNPGAPKLSGTVEADETFIGGK